MNVHYKNTFKKLSFKNHYLKKFIFIKKKKQRKKYLKIN